MKEFLANIIKAITPIVDKIEDFLVDLAGKQEYIGILVALAVSAVIILGFLVSLFAVCKNKTTKLTKEIKNANAFLRNSQPIDEDNINSVYSIIKKLPESLQKAWGTFLDQQTGYPSDYLSKKVLLEDGQTVAKRKGGKSLYKFISTVVILLGFGLLAIATKDVLHSISMNASLVNKVTNATISILGGLFAPLIVYCIFLAIVKGIYNKQLKKLVAEYDIFQDLLDEKIIIFNIVEDEFVTENIEEINAAIEEIIARKMEKQEVIEISTTPKISDDLPKLEEPVIVPLEEEVVAEVAYAPVVEELTEEEKAEEQRFLARLIAVVEGAIADKDNTSAQDLEDLAVLIANAKDKGYKDPRDQEILEHCLQMLADLYFNQ